eukprot:3307329-Amphidinium_carterae.1
MHQLLTQQRELSEQLEKARRQMVQGRAEGARYQTRAIALGEELTQERQHRNALQEFIQALLGQAQARDALVQNIQAQLTTLQQNVRTQAQQWETTTREQLEENFRQRKAALEAQAEAMVHTRVQVITTIKPSASS